MRTPDGTVQLISAEATYPLRQRILRPMQIVAECAYPEDHAAEAYHAGYVLDGELVGVGTIFRQAHPGSTLPQVWRVRGMAVAEQARGQNIGGVILRALLTHARAHGTPAEVWCHGRAKVQGFYERLGFHREGEIFDQPPVGPHVLMSLILHDEDASRATRCAPHGLLKTYQLRVA